MHVGGRGCDTFPVQMKDKLEIKLECGATLFFRHVPDKHVFNVFVDYENMEMVFSMPENTDLEQIKKGVFNMIKRKETHE